MLPECAESVQSLWLAKQPPPPCPPIQALSCCAAAAAAVSTASSPSIISRPASRSPSWPLWPELGRLPLGSQRSERLWAEKVGSRRLLLPPVVQAWCPCSLVWRDGMRGASFVVPMNHKFVRQTRRSLIGPLTQGRKYVPICRIRLMYYA